MTKTFKRFLKEGTIKFVARLGVNAERLSNTGWKDVDAPDKPLPELTVNEVQSIIWKLAADFYLGYHERNPDTGPGPFDTPARMRRLHIGDIEIKSVDENTLKATGLFLINSKANGTESKGTFDFILQREYD